MMFPVMILILVFMMVGLAYPIVFIVTGSIVCLLILWILTVPIQEWWENR